MPLALSPWQRGQAVWGVEFRGRGEGAGGTPTPPLDKPQSCVKKLKRHLSGFLYTCLLMILLVKCSCYASSITSQNLALGERGRWGEGGGGRVGKFVLWVVCGGPYESRQVEKESDGLTWPSVSQQTHDSMNLNKSFPLLSTPTPPWSSRSVIPVFLPTPPPISTTSSLTGQDMASILHIFPCQEDQWRYEYT